MTALLQQLDIFELRPLITNLNCKLSTISEYATQRQLLCLISEENDIVLRYTSDGGQEVLKMISWFRRTNRVIHDICFDPSGTWLLVLCFDNTLHIVPALAVVDRTHMESSSSAYPQQPYSTTQVTSYIIPFVGPHECPNSQQCPNHSRSFDATQKHDLPTAKTPKDNDSLNAMSGEVELLTQELATSTLDELSSNGGSAKEQGQQQTEKVVDVLQHSDDVVGVPTTPPAPTEPPTMEVFSHDMPENMLGSHAPPNQCADTTGNSHVMASSFMASTTCPYPLSVVWWQTIDGLNRAIIGYSDGSICFVGLSPNCPFVASTAIDSGSVVKLLICKDNTFESVMLLITSSLKQQYKLLLEQKAIKYIYPGDTSPSNAQSRDSDWQIVMPLKSNSNCSDPASDSSQLDEDVFARTASDEQLPSSAGHAPPAVSTAPIVTVLHAPPQPSAQLTAIINPSSTAAAAAAAAPAAAAVQYRGISHQMRPTVPPPSYTCTSQMPPPPPYSVAISRHLDSAATSTLAGSNGPAAATLTTSTAITTTATAAGAGATTSGGVRFHQQNLSDFDDFHGRAGILPAARARLASLKSLGSKKLNAIKMRLSDNRQKLEECIPENTLASSFAIMDSPSLTPELLGTTHGSFYTIQNLRNTYLLSALHSESSSLSVHNIDVHLKPLILYKIPKNCLDILISSNILYFIQYVEKAVPTPTVKPVKRSQDSSMRAAKSVVLADGDDEMMITVKESLDKDVEKQEKYTEVPVEGAAALTVDDNQRTNPDSSAATSAATTTKTDPATQSSLLSPTNLVNAVGVISSAMATMRSGDEDKFNVGSQLGLFRFEHETVLSLYQMATYQKSVLSSAEPINKEEKRKAFHYKDIRSPVDYVHFYETAPDVQDEFSLRQMEIMQNEFPKIHYDPCYVVTNKNVYYIQLKKEPFAIFLDAALASEWRQCREFCNTFNLTYETCIEFAGDYLLRRKKVTQALLTYNTARIKPIRTALKLAIYGQTCALMHLCAMALKTTFLIKSQSFCHPIIKSIMADITYRHSEDVRTILPQTAWGSDRSGAVVNEGAPCSDYVYGVDEPLSNLQMSPSSQFHLANLLLITLAEKAVNDKNYLPLWNFLVTNTKYHTNMTSIVLCQSGLFSAALILAKMRGVCIDTYLALTSVVGQEFGWYTELNVCLYNLSEDIFTETIAYLPQISVDYFGFIQDKVEHIRQVVLQRLEQQLNPFTATLRPIVSHTSAQGHLTGHTDNNTFLFEFCKTLIETYLAVLIHMESQRTTKRRVQHITNALSTFRITYEDNQFAIESARFKPISAGCAHCACVVDGVAYFWGSNGVPCNFSVSKSSDPPEPPHAVKSLELLAQLNLEVHAVKCGRQHTLVLTNNGLYAFGNNNLLQLGIGRQMQVSLQPMLVKAFDGKNVTVLEAGQYHNAAVADGQLYTWGWGVYGQLGHGDTENVAVPKLVSFFKAKRVIQVSLGHAHSLVLCQGPQNTTELYVFGSNHFGQLGIGTGVSARHDIEVDDGGEKSHANTAPDDELQCASQVKSLLPMRLDVSTARIRLIHTKFFTNLAVDENERMYTWGSSPQALRLANQIKKRANAKQKIEEHQRREMSKRFEATLTLNADTEAASTSAAAAMARCQLNAGPDTDPTTTTTITTADDAKDECSIAAASESATDVVVVVGDEPAAIAEVAPQDTACTEVGDSTNQAVGSRLNEELVDNTLLDPLQPPTEATSQADLTQEPTRSEQDLRRSEFMAEQKQSSTEVDPCEHMLPLLVDTSEIAGQILQISSGLFHFALISSSCTLYTWGKNLEHQLGTCDKERRAVNKPSPIDTIERPMYVDCGADFTLVMTTEFVVKAFGGNSNGQCGRDLGQSIDRMKQRVVCLPTTKRLMRFESQCVEVPVEINLPRPRIRLDNEPVRYLKSIPRFQAHFLQEAAVHLDGSAHYIRRQSASVSQQYKSTQADSESERDAMTGQDSDDLISSLENYSNKDDASSLNLSAPLIENGPLYLCASPPPTGTIVPAVAMQLSSGDVTPDEHSFAHLLPPAATAAISSTATATATAAATVGEDNGNVPLAQSVANAAALGVAGIDCGSGAGGGGVAVVVDGGGGGGEDSPAYTLTSERSDEVDARDDNADDEGDLQALRHYIHYCLYVFHGLYNPDKVRDFAKERLEYRIRTHMLNFKFVDAFTLCLEACDTPGKALKIFEYFTRDTSSSYVHVPMRRQDLKYLIYYLLLHFLRHKFEMLECERFFVGDLDYYLLELAYVLYFNNNNTALEQTLNQKFKDLIALDPIDPNSNTNVNANANANANSNSNANANATMHEERQHKLEETDVIFDSLSVKFKTIVCQRLLKYCSSN